MMGTNGYCKVLDFYTQNFDWETWMEETCSDDLMPTATYVTQY